VHLERQMILSKFGALSPATISMPPIASHVVCAFLADIPLAGGIRQDLTTLPVRFWLVQPYRKPDCLQTRESRFCTFPDHPSDAKYSDHSAAGEKRPSFAKPARFDFLGLGVVFESNPTNPKTGICDWKTKASSCQSPNALNSPGFYTDDYTAGSTSPNTVTQTFFIDLGQVRVFWPDSAFTTWYGSWTQNATVDANNPIGAKIIQNSPDLQHGFSCSPLECSTARLP
jgi:hypothetical protein